MHGLIFETNCLVLIWTDLGHSLSHSHRGPWVTIERSHSSNCQFVPIPMHYSNKSIKRLVASASRESQGDNGNRSSQLFAKTGLLQTLSNLHQDLSTSIDVQTASQDPFYALDEIFRLHAASEYQFYNLMEEKVREHRERNHQLHNEIAEIHKIKELVDEHSERLQDTIETLHARGGYGWPQDPQTSHESKKRAEDSIRCLVLIFQRLSHRAKAVSDACQNTMAMLSNDAMVREAQKTMQQAEGMAKITFIAFFFVPISFTTSFFGMNFFELNIPGLKVWVWFIVSLPVLLISLLVWWMDGGRWRRFWKILKGVVSMPFHKHVAGEESDSK